MSDGNRVRRIIDNCGFGGSAAGTEGSARIAKKSARAYVGLRGFMKTNWLALAEGEAGEDGAHKPAAKG